MFRTTMFTTRQSRETLMNAIYGTIFYGGFGIMIAYITESPFMGVGFMLSIYGLSQLLYKLVDWVYDGKENSDNS